MLAADFCNILLHGDVPLLKRERLSTRLCLAPPHLNPNRSALSAFPRGPPLYAGDTAAWQFVRSYYSVRFFLSVHCFCLKEQL